jgi:hypothetical protein
MNPVSWLSSDPKGILMETEMKLKEKFNNELAIMPTTKHNMITLTRLNTAGITDQG